MSSSRFNSKPYDPEKEYRDETFKYCGVSIHVWVLVIAIILLASVVTEIVFDIRSQEWLALVSPGIALIAIVLLILGNRLLKPVFYYLFLALCVVKLLVNASVILYSLITGNELQYNVAKIEAETREEYILLLVLALLISTGFWILAFFVALMDFFYVKYALEDHMSPSSPYGVYPAASDHSVEAVEPSDLRVETA